MFGPLAITSSLGFQNSRQSRTPTPANSPVPLSTCVWVVLLEKKYRPPRKYYILISYHFDAEKRDDDDAQATLKQQARLYTLAVLVGLLASLAVAFTR
jgi:hypothetical protein